MKRTPEPTPLQVGEQVVIGSTGKKIWVVAETDGIGARLTREGPTPQSSSRSVISVQDLCRVSGVPIKKAAR